jgi:uncharacterized membrane protein YidH (DUF202 family)
MNISQTHIQTQLGNVLSWLATGAVALLCTALGLASVHFVEPFAAMFRGLGVELPWPTRFLLATHVPLLPLFFIALAALVIWKGLSVREPRRRLILTARLFLAALFASGLVVFILYLPLLILGKKLGEAK